MSKKVKELEDKLKRALADYDNFSKRVIARQSSWEEESKARIIDKLLDVYDDLLRAKDHIDNQGLSMAVNQFWAVLESEGVTKIETKGEEFDPESMDCVQVVEGKENIVIETMSVGYRLNEKVIRPAKVKVGKGRK